MDGHAVGSPHRPGNERKFSSHRARRCLLRAVAITLNDGNLAAQFALLIASTLADEIRAARFAETAKRNCSRGTRRGESRLARAKFNSKLIVDLRASPGHL